MRYRTHVKEDSLECTSITAPSELTNSVSSSHLAHCSLAGRQLKLRSRNERLQAAILANCGHVLTGILHVIIVAAQRRRRLLSNCKAHSVCAVYAVSAVQCGAVQCSVCRGAGDQDSSAAGYVVCICVTLHCLFFFVRPSGYGLAVY